MSSGKKMVSRSYLLKVLLLAGLVQLVCFVSAQAQAQAQDENAMALAVHDEVGFQDLPVPRGFEGRIAFWRYIFTKYGDNHRVFHHRQHPAIIYSVLDFSEINERLSGKANYRARDKAVTAELARIRAALKELARGAKPKGALQQRIVEQFRKLGLDSRKEYKKAAGKKQLRYQRGIKERFKEGLERSGRYLYAIENIFKTEKLPLGLSRLPLVESSFDYKAYSSVGAAGIWQFMRGTGKSYLRIDASIDERRDPILATRAATRYLNRAFDVLGTWPLAITSYNHGIAGIKRAVKQTGSTDLSVIVKKYKGRTFGFASSNFYAEFLAALEVERNATFYFPDLKREQPWYFDEVRLGKSLRFSELAKKVGISKQALAELNLSFRSPVQTDRVWVPRGSVVKFPRGKGKLVLASVANSKLIRLNDAAAESKSDLRYKARVSGMKYKVRRGDTAGGIAQRYNVSQRELLAANGIRNPRYLRAGSTIRIPGRGGKRSSGGRNTASGSYRVTSGDTLGAIARDWNVSVSELKRSNNLRSNTIRVGQVLKVPGKSGKKLAKNKYIVKKGDTLSGIAQATGSSVASLKRLNPAAAKLIKPGQVIRIR